MMDLAVDPVGPNEARYFVEAELQVPDEVAPTVHGVVTVAP